MKTNKITAAIIAATLATTALTATAFADAPAVVATEEFKFEAGQVWAFTPDDETAFYFGFTSATGGYRYDTISHAYAEFTLTTNKDGSFTLTTGEDKLTFTVERTSENTLKVTGNDTTAFWYSYNDILDIDSFLTIFNEEVKKYLLPAGTYKLTKVNSDTVKYLILTSETEGVLESADGKTSVPFTVEQDIYEGTLTFHFGGVDDTTVVRVDTANDILTFDDGNYRLMPISSEDQDDIVEDTTVEDVDEDDATVDDVDDATIEEDEAPTETSEVVTTTAATSETSLMFTGDEIASAFEKSGNDTILYITLTEAKPFTAKLIFKTTAGGARTYTIEASGKNGTSYFTLQDALTALNLKTSDIATLEVDSAAVKTASLTKRPAGVAASAASGDENPATGVSLAVIPAAFAGIAAFFTRKRK